MQIIDPTALLSLLSRLQAENMQLMAALQQAQLDLADAVSRNDAAGDELFTAAAGIVA